jgi:hypothetical protein
MKSIIKRAGLLAAAFVVCLGGSAQAQDETIDVKVPFPFVVHGKTLPAGEYRVENHGAVVLLRGEKGTKANMFVLTNPSGSPDPAGDKPALNFTRSENQYRLTDIWESSSQGLEIVR